MKFYFCEKCGKRVTDRNIKDGEARDKKLRGVFCTECAEGVMTMETVPLSDREAKALVTESSSKSPAQADSASATARRSSATRLRPGASARAAREASAGAKSSPVPVVAGLAAAVLLLGGVWLVMGSGESKRSDPARARRATPKGERAGKSYRRKQARPVRPALPTEDKVIPEPSLKNAVTPAPQPAKDPVEAEKDTPDAGRGEKDVPSPNAVAKAGDGAADEPVEEPKLRPASETRKPEPSSKEALQTERDRRRAREAFAAILDRFEAAVTKEAWEEAVRIGKEAAGDPLQKEHVPESAALAGVAASLKERAAQIQAALKGLMDGKERAYVTRKGVLRSVAERFKEGSLLVKVKGRINNRSVEYGKQIRISDLTEAGRRQLGLAPQMDSEQAWVAQAIRESTAGRFEEAARALERAGAHPLKAVWDQRLDARRKQHLETQIGEAWEEIRRLARNGKWKLLGPALARFEKLYGGTDTAKRYGEELAGLRGRLREEEMRSEGLFFDFEKEADFRRFTELFSAVQNSKYARTHEGGAMVITRKGDHNDYLKCYAPKLVLGSAWRLRIRGGFPKFGRSQYSDVRLLFTKVTGGRRQDRGSFAMIATASMGGHAVAGLRKAGGKYTDTKPEGLFAGMPTLGFYKRGLGESGRWEKKVAWWRKDRQWLLEIEKRGRRMKAVVNGEVVLDAELPEKAAHVIAGSVLGLFSKIPRGVPTIRIFEFGFRRLLPGRR